MSNGARINGHLDGELVPTPDIYSASSTAEIKAALENLSQREKSITSKLDTLLASQKDLSRQLTRLDLARAQLGPQVIAIRSVSNGMLSSAASTADRISGAVKRLDQEQAAVKATLEVVEQVSELKSCVIGVHGSMGMTQDWETAAAYLSRASKIPDEVIDGAFAEETVPTAEIPDPPRVTLNQAAEGLCSLFLREFEKATKEGDGGRVTRFFKLFPLIGRTDVGLDAYGRYVCGGVAARARNNLNTTQKKEGMFYAMALTKLFEHVAQIVDGHEPLVTRHYGPGMMTKVVERLQVEADLQGGIILDTWTDDRQISRKMTDVKSYAFSFLVQSFLPSNKPSARSTSPVVRDSISGRPSEDEGVNMKEVDSILSEIALMLGRWALYARFIASKTGVVDEEEKQKVLSLPALVSNSNLQRKITEQLTEPFNVMSTFFFRRSVEKAFQMDEQPPDLTLNPHKPLGSNPPFITSAVDDVMYIVTQVLQRSLGTSQRSVVGSVVPSLSRVLNSDFYGMIQRKMRDESYPKAAIQGALPPESVIISFLVLINNLDVSTDYVRRIVNDSLGQRRSSQSDGMETKPSLQDLFPFGHDSVFVETQLKNLLNNFEAKTSELLNEAIEVMLKQVMRPRLRPVMIETFREIDYMPLENYRGAADADGDENDLVLQRFERGWQAFTLPIKRIATDRVYDKLLTSTINHLSKQLEKRIWSHYGRVNELGAIRLERDVTGIVNIAVKGGRYQLRDMFTRCSQMTLILNMDEEEWDELEKAKPAELEEMGIPWQLDADERKRTRSIITDQDNLQ